MAGVQLPRYAQELFRPHRYKVLYGGRGSGKSYSIARALLLEGRKRKCRVLCAREFQNSIKESVHFLLKQEISKLGLDSFYTVHDSTIRGKNGTEFIFTGIRMNIESIKSMAGITHVWLEEAQTISQTSWDFLVPTIREPGSEIWVSFNPLEDDDPTYTMFVDPKTNMPLEMDNAYIAFVNYWDNPWFPEVLEDERVRLFAKDPEKAAHVWNGECRQLSDAQIFAGKYSVRPFEIEPEMDGAYQGADWGFSVDPNTLVKVYLDLRDENKKRLLIRNCVFGYKTELKDIPELWEKVPDVHDTLVRADSARPETISHVASEGGFVIEGVEKWTGSVEDGIEWMRSFDEIVIHPDCDPELIREFKKYSYKVDRLTGDVTTDIVDAYNHGIDAIRYACAPIIQASLMGILNHV